MSTPTRSFVLLSCRCPRPLRRLPRSSRTGLRMMWPRSCASGSKAPRLRSTYFTIVGERPDACSRSSKARIAGTFIGGCAAVAGLGQAGDDAQRVDEGRTLSSFMGTSKIECHQLRISDVSLILWSLGRVGVGDSLLLAIDTGLGVWERAMMSKIMEARSQAARLRALATTAPDASRCFYLQIAAGWDHIAKELEFLNRANVKKANQDL
jgi:hypothetical protein